MADITSDFKNTTNRRQIFIFEFKRLHMDLEKTRQFLVETEAAAQEVLIAKEELIGLDFKRQKTREAFRALQNVTEPKEKVWMSFGGLLVKTPTSKATNLLQRGN